MLSRSRTLLCVRVALSPSLEARSGSETNGEGWLASLSLFAFPVSPKPKRIWNAGRRRALNLRTCYGAAPPPEWERAARLPAFHHGSSQGVCSPLVRSGPGFVGKPSKRRGSLRRRPDHFQRRTSHAGRNAGRHDARTARERVASPPAGSASRPAAAICLRGGVLYGRDDSGGYVTKRETYVKWRRLKKDVAWVVTAGPDPAVHADRPKATTTWRICRGWVKMGSEGKCWPLWPAE